MQAICMQSADGSQEDATLLLAIKDAEISTLRQQMAQLADDLKRNLAVSAWGYAPLALLQPSWLAPDEMSAQLAPAGAAAQYCRTLGTQDVVQYQIFKSSCT
jgi:hypothetical protein